MLNYWKQRAIKSGHDTRLILAKLVSAVRQSQKNKNNVIEIVQTFLLAEVKFISDKSVKQRNYNL